MKAAFNIAFAVKNQIFLADAKQRMVAYEYGRLHQQPDAPAVKIVVEMVKGYRPFPFIVRRVLVNHRLLLRCDRGDAACRHLAELARKNKRDSRHQADRKKPYKFFAASLSVISCCHRNALYTR